jgi:hypothetical protein
MIVNNQFYDSAYSLLIDPSNYQLCIPPFIKIYAYSNLSPNSSNLQRNSNLCANSYRTLSNTKKNSQKINSCNFEKTKSR